MKTYEKPIVLANSELSEGVFAASGTGPVGPAASSGGVSVSSVTMKEQGNPNYKVNKYDVVIKNDSDQELTDWAAALNVSGATNAQIYNGWQAGASLNGGAITITPGGGGTIPPGGSITVEVVVSYDGDGVSIG